MKCAIIAITDDFRDRLNLAKIGAAKRNVAKSPDEIVVQLVPKQSDHGISHDVVQTHLRLPQTDQEADARAAYQAPSAPRCSAENT